MKKRIQNKNKLKNIITFAVFILGLCHTFILLKFICDDLIQVLLWGIAIDSLIGSLVLFNIELPNKSLKFDRIIYTVIGGILFCIDSFVFIENLYISILLPLTISIIFTGIVLMRYLKVDKSNLPT